MFGFCLTPHPSSFSLSLNVVFLYWCAKAMCWNFVSFFFFFQFHFTVIKKAGYSLIFVVSSAVQQVVRYISPGCNWWMIQLFRSELQIAVGLLCCTSSPRSESLELKELIVCKALRDFRFLFPLYDCCWCWVKAALCLLVCLCLWLFTKEGERTGGYFSHVYSLARLDGRWPLWWHV